MKGRTMSMLFPAPAPPDAPRSITRMFDRGKWRRSANGWIRIKHMTPAHRANVARGLMRAVDTVATSYIHVTEIEMMLYNAPDGVFNSIMNDLGRIDADRKAWLRGTKLYRKLTKDLDLKLDMRVDDDH